MEQRRRANRQGACWSGRYKTDERRSSVWHECLVVDISPLGIGLSLDGPIPAEVLGKRIEVEVHVPGQASVNIRLTGDVKHAAQHARGGARLGMEFGELSEEERSILDTLELVHVG